MINFKSSLMEIKLKFVWCKICAQTLFQSGNCISFSFLVHTLQPQSANITLLTGFHLNVCKILLHSFWSQSYSVFNHFQWPQNLSTFPCTLHSSCLYSKLFISSRFFIFHHLSFISTDLLSESTFLNYGKSYDFLSSADVFSLSVRDVYFKLSFYDVRVLQFDTQWFEFDFRCKSNVAIVYIFDNFFISIFSHFFFIDTCFKNYTICSTLFNG